MGIATSHGGKKLPPAGTAPTQVNVLPEPVEIPASVRAAFAQPPISHRSERYVDLLRATRGMLCHLVRASDAAILMGSGTLANDVVAAQLTRLTAPGLILVNGEFGTRLTDHARRFGLDFAVVQSSWGEALAYDTVHRALDNNPRARWLWAPHCETSTGVLNDLDALIAVAADYELRLCVDAISSIGTVPVDLTNVYLASGVSGKGLASYPGLAMVFFHHDVTPSAKLPRYLDLGIYAQAEGVPFTASSNLLFALACALERYATPERAAGVFRARRDLETWLRGTLAASGLAIMAPEAIASPAVFTLQVPPSVASRDLGDHLARRGFLVSYQSAYLVEHNVIQICLMGEVTRAALRALVGAVRDYLAHRVSA